MMIARNPLDMKFMNWCSNFCENWQGYDTFKKAWRFTGRNIYGSGGERRYKCGMWDIYWNIIAALGTTGLVQEWGIYGRKTEGLPRQLLI